MAATGMSVSLFRAEVLLVRLTGRWSVLPLYGFSGLVSDSDGRWGGWWFGCTTFLYFGNLSGLG